MNNERKIGRNIIIKCCNNSIALGSPTEIKLIIIYSILMSLSFALWNGFLYSFLHLSVIILCAIIYLVTIINYLICFFKEPGIIPRDSCIFPMNKKETAAKKGVNDENQLAVLNVENIKVINKNSNTNESDNQDFHSKTKEKEKEKEKNVFNLIPELEEDPQSKNI